MMIIMIMMTLVMILKMIVKIFFVDRNGGRDWEVIAHFSMKQSFLCACLSYTGSCIMTMAMLIIVFLRKSLTV